MCGLSTKSSSRSKSSHSAVTVHQASAEARLDVSLCRKKPEKAARGSQVSLTSRCRGEIFQKSSPPSAPTQICTTPSQFQAISPPPPRICRGNTGELQSQLRGVIFPVGNSPSRRSSRHLTSPRRYAGSIPNSRVPPSISEAEPRRLIRNLILGHFPILFILQLLIIKSESDRDYGSLPEERTKMEGAERRLQNL